MVNLLAQLVPLAGAAPPAQPVHESLLDRLLGASPLVLVLVFGILMAWLAIQILQAKVPWLRKPADKQQSKQADTLSSISAAATRLAAAAEKIDAAMEKHLAPTQGRVRDLHAHLLDQVAGSPQRATCGACDQLGRLEAYLLAHREPSGMHDAVTGERIRKG